jgi:hypothetical protein
MGKMEDSITAMKNNAQEPPGRSAQLNVQSYIRRTMCGRLTGVDAATS